MLLSMSLSVTKVLGNNGNHQQVQRKGYNPLLESSHRLTAFCNSCTSHREVRLDEM